MIIYLDFNMLEDTVGVWCHLSNGTLVPLCKRIHLNADSLHCCPFGPASPDLLSRSPHLRLYLAAYLGTNSGRMGRTASTKDMVRPCADSMLSPDAWGVIKRTRAASVRFKRMASATK